MKSRFHQYKDQVLELRKKGVSMTVIERQFGIPRSTLSYWFRSIQLTEEQRTALNNNSIEGRLKGNKASGRWHNTQKRLRLLKAWKEADATLNKITLSPEVLDIAFAMLYLGEGAKTDLTSISNSDAKVLNFVLKVLELNYDVSRNLVTCYLHLRTDQDPDLLKKYWSEQLGIPLENFKGVSIDQRSKGKPTYEHYKGVCVLTCGRVAIQRKLIYLYTQFCEKIIAMDWGD